MKFDEVGSEFWLEKLDEKKKNDLSYFQLGKDHAFLLSGRTAIYFILENILKTKKIKNVYMPSYCCKSILQVFIDKKINIEFYDVNYNNGIIYNINTNKKYDIFFAMNYFGYTSTNMAKHIKEFKNKGTIVIEDITHSLLSDIQYCEFSDYLIASLRKWFPIMTGGLAVNLNNEFIIKEKYKDNIDLVNIKKNAMLLKHEYIENKERTYKEEFLRTFNIANNILEKDYKRYKMDNESIEILKQQDISFIKKQRKENAKTIYDTIKSNKVKFLVPNLEKRDCPLFVPIIVEKQLKLKIKRFLIDNRIYCPSHWTKPDLVKNGIIYTNEISLICDQRYNVKEIKRYINLMMRCIEES